MAEIAFSPLLIEEGTATEYSPRLIAWTVTFSPLLIEEGTATSNACSTHPTSTKTFSPLLIEEGTATAGDVVAAQQA